MIQKQPQSTEQMTAGLAMEALATLPDATLILDSTQTIIYANRAAVVAAGNCDFRAELVGQRLVDFLVVRDREYLHAALDSIGQDGLQNLHLEVQLVPKNSLPMTVHMSVSHLPMNDERYFTVVIRQTAHAHEIDESEAFYRRVVEDQLDYVARALPDGTLVLANKAMRELLGVSEENINGVDFVSFVYPDDRPIVAAHVQRLLEKTLTHETVEYRLQLPDGKVRWVQWTNRAIYDSQYRVSQIQGVGRDITNIKQHTQALEHLLERRNAQLERMLHRVELILGNTVDGILLLDSDAKIEQANPSVYDMIQAAPDALYQKPLGTFIHDDDQAVIENSIATALSDHTIQRTEARIVALDGSVYETEIVLSPLMIEDDGENQLLCNIHDVTHIKQVQHSLEESEARLRLLFEAVPDALVITDKDGNIMDLNRAAGKHIDSPVQELIGQHYKALLTPELEHQLTEANLLSRLTTYMQRPIEFMYSTPRGNRYYELTVYPLVKERNIYLLTVARDITKMKQSQLELLQMFERERQINHSKSQFVTTTSHEFRTPLATINATIETLRDFGERMTVEQRAHRFDKVRAQIAHMTGMLDELLTLERLSNDKPMLKMQTIVLDDCLTALLDTMQSVYPNYHFAIQQPESPVTLIADANLFQQILENVVSNAAKYSSADEIIEIVVTVQDNMLQVSVNDHGIGITEDDLPHIFDGFRRGSNVNSRPGTGVGLAIVKRGVQAHGGTVDVTSILDEGTSIKIELPIVDTTQ